MAFETGFHTFNSGNDQAPSGPITPRLRFLSWKDQEKHVLRFLTDIDDVIKGEFAEYVVTNRVKDDGTPVTDDFLIDPDGTNWVKHYGAKSKAFNGDLVEPRFRKLGVAVAVLRKEVSLGGGRIEVVDEEPEIEVDGKKYKARTFVVVIQSPRNFWEHFEGMANRNKTIVDRDYEIIRKGFDKTTRYQVGPYDPIEELRDPRVLHETYGYGRKFNPEDPDRFLYCPETIQEWAARYSGEERARALLGPRDGSPTTLEQRTANINSGLDEFAPVSLDAADEAQSSNAADFAKLRDQLQSTLQK